MWVYGGSLQTYDNYDGGYVSSDSEISNNVNCYDLLTHTWKNVVYNGKLRTLRLCHQTALVDDTVWLFGGEHDESLLSDLYVLSLSSFTWTEI